MENRHVDIIIILCCILGIAFGMTVSSYATFIYNMISYILIIIGMYYCISKLFEKH